MTPKAIVGHSGAIKEADKNSEKQPLFYIA